MSAGKDLLYKGVKQDSRGMAKLGNALGWDFLEEEAKHNTKNPGRAVGKAATSAALWYLGGPAWSGAGSAAGTATEQAATIAAEEAAKEAAKQEVLQSAQYAAQQGLLNGGTSFASSAPGPGVVAPGMQSFANMDTMMIHGVPEDFAGGAAFGRGNTMESALQDTGYTPSSLWNAVTRGPGSGQSMGDTLGNFASNKGRGILQKFQNAPSNMAAKFQDSGTYKKAALKMGAGLLDQPQQQPMSRPMMPQQQEQQPSQPFYGGQGGMYQGGLLGMSEEEKRRLRMMGYQV